MKKFLEDLPPKLKEWFVEMAKYSIASGAAFTKLKELFE